MKKKLNLHIKIKTDCFIVMKKKTKFTHKNKNRYL